MVDRLAYIDVNYNHVQCSHRKSAQLISDGIEKGLMCFEQDGAVNIYANCNKQNVLYYI